MHLRHAAERVGVLHLAAVRVALHDLAVGEQRAQVRRDDAPARGAGARPCRRSSNGRFEPLSASRLIAPATSASVQSASASQQRERAERGHVLRAVDEREPLLRLEHDRARGPPRASASAPGMHLTVAKLRLALADQREREVRERREIAGRADRALRRDARRDAAR